MNLSIKNKLFAAMSLLILFFVLLSWLLNNFLLDKYYMHSKKNALIDCYKQIDSIYNGDPEAISLELEMLETTKGMHIVILDKNLKAKYVFNQRLMDFLPKKPGRPRIFGGTNLHDILTASKVEEVLSGKTVIETGKDERLNSNFIILYSLLNNKDLILLSTSVAAIQESANIASKFYIFTGILTILLGSIIIFFITGRFTKPILVLNNITKGMATLDFSKRYDVRSNDEVGQLGASINSLSEQLEQSIFELKEANQKLMRDIERERKIDEMRKEFISSVSHELKTPIALIQGYAEGLRVNVNEDEENKNFYCDIITDEALKMNKLVKQLLELSKIESGAIELEKTEFKAIDLIEHVLRKNIIISREQNIDIGIGKKDEIVVNADFDRAEQVLSNYINNAIDHLDNKRIIRVNINRNESKARIRVFNSGKHIPEESMEKIWTSFYKVDKARTRAFGGSGLGLSIVRAIQEAHHNSYGVENVEGGVEFWFELDIAEE